MKCHTDHIYHLSFLFLLEFLMKLPEGWSTLVMRITGANHRASPDIGRARGTDAVADGRPMLRGRRHISDTRFIVAIVASVQA